MSDPQGDEKVYRRTPPEKDEHWLFWRALSRTDRMWTIVGPIYSIVNNWRWVIVVAAVIALLNWSKIAEAMKLLPGVMP